MDEHVKQYFDNLRSTDDKIRMDAFQNVMKLTDHKVVWVYEVWEELFEKLNSENSFQRSIGIIVLCNLAKSDVDDRLISTLDLILAHTKDEKFITSRQCIQNVWKIAVASPRAREKVIDHLEKRFTECLPEKHYNLLRTDIIQSMKYIYDAIKDDLILGKMQVLIREEKEDKYRKNYQAIMRS